MTDRQLIIWLWAVAAVSVFAIFSPRRVEPEPVKLSAGPDVVAWGRQTEMQCHSCHTHRN